MDFWQMRLPSAHKCTDALLEQLRKFSSYLALLLLLLQPEYFYWQTWTLAFITSLLFQGVNIFIFQCLTGRDWAGAVCSTSDCHWSPFPYQGHSQFCALHSHAPPSSHDLLEMPTQQIQSTQEPSPRSSRLTALPFLIRPFQLRPLRPGIPIAPIVEPPPIRNPKPLFLYLRPQ